MDLGRPKMVNGRMCVEVVTSGMQPEQNFDRRRFVLKGISEGWAKLSDDEKTLTVHATPEDLVFDVVRAPGYYCVSTGERIPLSKFAEEEAFNSTTATMAAGEARKWLVAKKLPLMAGKLANYEAPKHYACKLNAKQHEKFRAVQNVAGNWVAAQTLKGA